MGYASRRPYALVFMIRRHCPALAGMEFGDRCTNFSHEPPTTRRFLHRVRRSAILRATEQPIDTSTAAGKCFLDMLGVSGR